MASLMAEALDVASENFLKLTKYDKLTALSRTLRDDPSCQLCSILVKYGIKMEAKDIENNLKGVPPLTTLRQGIVVLFRQWKNVRLCVECPVCQAVEKCKTVCRMSCCQTVY